MDPLLDQLLDTLAQAQTVLVTVGRTWGSVPRETGAWMAVTPHDVIGTIGGGHLEWDAIRRARESLASGHSLREVRQIALGPSLGQCCGGRLELVWQPVGAANAPQLARDLAAPAQPVALFGGGHVGQALVRALAPLPYAVHWIDSRDGVFPPDLPARVRAEHSDPVQAAVDDLRPGSHVLVMSFSHAEDLDIVAACLQRQRRLGDLGFIGLIGSRTKWARFGHRLQAMGFSAQETAQVTCPIGLPGIAGKAPAVIAASVVAQLLLVDTL
ncbi:MAG: xanthine dehydrogenase accessory protein XdhC [Gammaproteobacteria bacterium]